jgi:hypothetical protein
MRELTDIWTRHDSYAVMFVWIPVERRRVFLLRKYITGKMRKMFRWKSKRKVKGAGKIREEPDS